VPLYRSATKAPETSTWTELLAALPFITKQDVKTNFPQNFLRADQSLDDLVAKKLVEIEHTAGTTDNRADLLLPYGWWARQELWALSLNADIARVLSENRDAHRVTIRSRRRRATVTSPSTGHRPPNAEPWATPVI
jgi:hypothetical protein